MATDIHAVGRRKESIARVRLVPGTGQRTVNGKTIEVYFPRETMIDMILKPLEITSTSDRYDVHANVVGGGVTGQAGAVRLAVARALLKMNPELRATLRKGGFLTRDAREVERKKYGQPKARKRFQYSKR